MFFTHISDPLYSWCPYTAARIENCIFGVLWFPTCPGGRNHGQDDVCRGGPGNCCLSNNSNFQQTPIPIFHLVFKIATQSSGLLVDPACRRGKTGKKVTALLTQPDNWLAVGQYGHRRPFVGVNIFHFILLCIFQCDVLSKGKAMKIQIFYQWRSVLIFMKVKLEMKFSTFFSGNEKEQRMRFFWKTLTHVDSRHLILNIKKVKYFFVILPCTCSYYANS